MNNNHNRMLVANWKMYFTIRQADSFVTQYGQELAVLSAKSGVEMTLFPSFESLNSVASKLNNSSIKIGAQNCSAKELGAFTGQVCAHSLKEIGCSYVLVGHSEVRNECKATDELLLAQTERVLEQEMIPIFCIGETAEDYKQKITLNKLTAQLEPYTAALKITNKAYPLIIAYEPVWSIGTGLAADPEYLGTITRWIQEHMASFASSNGLKILYGGSVDDRSAKIFWSIEGISGLLVGKASTDFQLLKKIVLSAI